MKRPTTIVYITAGVYGIGFAAAGALRNWCFETGRFDLGNAVQAIWSTAHGHFLQVTSGDGEQFVRLGAHVDPLLVLFAPLWLLWSNADLLLATQALAVASGMLPVYWLARKHLASPQAAVSFAFAYLLFPATQWNAFTPVTNFHAVSFALPFLLFTLWFLDEERWLPFAVVALLAAAAKEEIPLVVGCFGIWYAVTHRRMRLGLAIFVIGLALTAVDFLIVIPHFAPRGEGPFTNRYAAVGGTPFGILRTTFTDPGRIVAAVVTVHKLKFMAELVVPWLGLCLLSPLLLLGAAPDLAINLLSPDPYQTSIRTHYVAAIAPCVVVATIFGAKKLRYKPSVVAATILVVVAVFATDSPLRVVPSDLRRAGPDDPVRRAKAAAIRLIPPNARVSASNLLGGRLSARERILMFPLIADAQWIAIDDTEQDPYHESVVRGLRKLHEKRRFQAVFRARGVFVFKRAPN